MVNEQGIYRFPMIIDRPGRQHKPFNAVLIMKDAPHFYPAPFNQNLLNPDAYFKCTQMLYSAGTQEYCDTFKFRDNTSILISNSSFGGDKLSFPIVSY